MFGKNSYLTIVESASQERECVCVCGGGGGGGGEEVGLNEHALNKIIGTQSVLCIIDCATQSSGRGIKGGALGGSALSCAHTWRPNSNFEKKQAHTQH